MTPPPRGGGQAGDDLRGKDNFSAFVSFPHTAQPHRCVVIVGIIPAAPSGSRPLLCRRLHRVTGTLHFECFLRVQASERERMSWQSSLADVQACAGKRARHGACEAGAYTATGVYVYALCYVWGSWPRRWCEALFFGRHGTS